MCDVYGVTWNVTGGLYPGSRCYYLRFLYGYADMTELLRQLLKKGSVCTWTSAYDAAFEELKRRLTSPPVLAHFSETDKTFVTCDASGVAVAAQLRDGVERPVAFGLFWRMRENIQWGNGKPLHASRRVSDGTHICMVVLSLQGRIIRLFKLCFLQEDLVTVLFAYIVGLIVYINTILRQNIGLESTIQSLIFSRVPVTPVFENSRFAKDVIQMIDRSLVVVTAEELKEQLENDSVLQKVRSYVVDGWPRRLKDEQLRGFFNVR